jgi:transcriptional regulator with XRE-family HTH domain
MYATEHIAQALKEARLRKELSQRALSEKAGVPQSHISKIEAGAVDLRLSSLIELARALDLELVLVPRNAIPAVNSLARSGEPRPNLEKATQFVRGAKQLTNLQNALNETLKRHPRVPELSQIQSRVKDLLRLHLQAPIENTSVLKAVYAAVKAYRETGRDEDIQRALAQITNLRNQRAHAITETDPIEPVRPAYSLDEPDNG